MEGTPRPGYPEPVNAALRHLILALAALALGGCASRAAPQLSDEAVVLQLPLVHQDELFECGLVSISALCAYYAIPIPAQLRAELALLAAEREGLSGGELRAALESLGMEVFVFPGTLDHAETGLLHQTDRGRPTLVMISEDGEHHHYCLFLGYDEPLGQVVLLDPLRGRVLLPNEVFMLAWERSRNFTLLSLPLETERGTEHADGRATTTGGR